VDKAVVAQCRKLLESMDCVSEPSVFRPATSGMGTSRKRGRALLLNNYLHPNRPRAIEPIEPCDFTIGKENGKIW